MILFFLQNLLIGTYFSVALVLMAYGLNCYVMIFLFLRGKKKAARSRKTIAGQTQSLISRKGLPRITTQIPVYNEYNVADRVIRAVCRMQYPKEKHEIQILDDSTDQTRELTRSLVTEMQQQGYRIQLIQREKRTGFKAGALANGMHKACGELLAVFDADFVPPRNFLKTILPYFLADDRLGLVQARWGHLNERRSLLTQVQSIGIDGHFMVEQAARNMSGLFMNFNGTAGVWRRDAIEDGGGWSWDTLTEDMDLSYRVQFKGWKTMFLPDLVVPAEIPEDINAFKSQQFRWAKGSIQTAKKLLPGLIRMKIPAFQKVQAFFHLTHYMVHPMILYLSITALPVLLLMKISLSSVLFGILAMILVLSMAAPSSLYLVSQRFAYVNWKSKMIYLPFLVMAGVGIAFSNTRAVLEALLNIPSDFKRTPKKGEQELVRYKGYIPWGAIAELLLGLYCACSFQYYLSFGKYWVGPFLAIYAFGFLFTGMLSLIHFFGRMK